ncbi:CBS-domain-containing protein [Exidia glandulosa HHB12029]|uniref:CBS-domain-containing protein n=1 Tax=Exidia glandulosa HHB12029 TaxID=1314781 RepID=A0A165PRK4_EXIGL|nr:CBS-domain-containing protein [Exidia glandulosa HHB12029]
MPSPPRNVRRKASTRRRAGSHLPPVQSQDTHDQALQLIRAFLKSRSAYDLLPVSFRIIVFDTELEVKKGLECMGMNSVVSASLWNSRTGTFAGMFTVLDVIHLIQHYYRTSNFQSAALDAESIRFDALRAIEKSLNVPPPPLLSIHPMRSLLEASTLLIKTHARRLPLIDRDSVTSKESLVSVLTQYRLLRFIARNCQAQISQLHVGLRRLKVGTYVDPRPDDPFYPIATARMDTTVFDVVHMFSERGISAVPILDENGVVVNLYETVDVISLVSDGAYQNLDLTIASALNKRSPDFPGVIVCTENDSLATLLSLLRQRRVHRLVVVEGDPSSAGLASSPSQSSLQMASMTAEQAQPPVDPDAPNAKVPGRLLGIITLSDVLRHIVGDTNSATSSSTPTTTSAPQSAVDTPTTAAPPEPLPPPPSIVEPPAESGDVAA